MWAVTQFPHWRVDVVVGGGGGGGVVLFLFFFSWRLNLFQSDNAASNFDRTNWRVKKASQRRHLCKCWTCLHICAYRGTVWPLISTCVFIVMCAYANMHYSGDFCSPTVNKKKLFITLPAVCGEIFAKSTLSLFNVIILLKMLKKSYNV